MREYLVTVVAGHIGEALASGDPVLTETDEYEYAQTAAGKYRCALSGAERDARRLLRKHWDVAEAVAQALLNEQVIDQARVDTLTASIEPAT